MAVTVCPLVEGLAMFLELRPAWLCRVSYRVTHLAQACSRWLAVRARSARRYLERHLPQSRDIGRCSPAWYGRGGVVLRAGCRSCGKSGQPSYAASSACHKRLNPSRCFQPSDAPAGHIGGWICEDLHEVDLGRDEPVARSIGSQASTELLDCSVISNWTGRPVFFWTIVARCRTLAPEQMSSSRSLTKSQARSLLSIARLKIARSRLDCAISRRTRMDQMCFGSRGFFWPMSNPLFQGRWPRSMGRTDIRCPPPSRPPRRSIASVSFIRLSVLAFPIRKPDRDFCTWKPGKEHMPGISLRFEPQ
jgi:hypothetical protein